MDNRRMNVIDMNDVAAREIFPGFKARVVHSARVSESWVEADAGASFPEHQHPHEQVVNVLEGELELVVAGVTHRLTPGQIFVIPPESPHAGRALTNCRVLDVFSPTRDDYR
jgi:quercetin dioxygenase-like cupin family protein